MSRYISIKELKTICNFNEAYYRNDETLEEKIQSLVDGGPNSAGTYLILSRDFNSMLKLRTLISQILISSSIIHSSQNIIETCDHRFKFSTYENAKGASIGLRINDILIDLVGINQHEFVNLVDLLIVKSTILVSLKRES